ncbi:glyoxal oxidase [Echria macrotheca]|uniref:Glyoxal oxidase n=1 Tax=Echria macrotheca TaxID=438768 RepID=A0AAJ0B5S0_9PEZI|nr:glyoxal oxidase [Echria macrotheca]
MASWLHRLAFLSSLSSAFIIPGALPGAWEYQGCYSDNTGSRTLGGGGYVDTVNMTAESCIDYCSTRGLPYAGTEWYHECFCGSSLAPGGVLASNQDDCNTACTGDSSQACGGPNRLSMFYSSQPVGPQPNAGLADWSYLGCYAEGTTGRALTLTVTTVPAGQMNAALCTAACQGQGFILAGTEYSGECYCGNTFANGAVATPVGADECSMICNGNSGETCGGPNRLNVYGYKTITTTSSTTSTTPPTSTPTTTTPTSPTSTPAATPTVVACPESNGTTYTSVNGKTFLLECYVDHLMGDMAMQYTNSYALCIEACSLTAGCISFAWVPGAPGPCYMKSSTGAPNTNAGVWGAKIVDFGSSSSSIPTTTPTTITSSSTSSSAASSPTGMPPGWTYQGCWVDNLNGRILPVRLADSPQQTQQLCAQACYTAGYNISATEYSRECYCGDFIVNGGKTTDDADCNMACSGDSTQMCGAGNRLTLFANGVPQAYRAPEVQTSGLNGSWTYQGCLEDNFITTGKRVFPWQITLSTLTTNECITRCAEFGYMAAGTEYHDECYCGDPSDIIAAGTTYTTEQYCDTPCAGNITGICGGQNRLSTYFWTGDPLYTWHYPIGPDAGEYRFLIGGVCIPLITHETINGKVVFLEKWGTGPPNSTGTYELDVTLVDNFTAAWRPLHLKTDVFCSAGVTLPDKAGRMLNVGGWSNPSTYGLRLFTPDGELGQWGVNDWEENADEFRLQDGRWYPSAMLMANGSVLVIGGEDGANAKAVPTIEILPSTGTKPLYMDWLARTDPNNLYPFTAVLPQGGIFVAYWNEARILDEVTFDTTVELPNIPGSVVDPTAGRTYPLEGTAVLLPQYYPFTDPLGVLICGGSTTGPGNALDNCVSIYPQVSNPVWTLERMPSKRVISCMAPLPDGTYLILNGAHQGVAGFGLATDPNLNAVLYDPSRPVGARMSVLANTTVARMYHSEAITLLDGRVLVSGSDPQDNVNPQEYRVEVFMPPYLLSGKPRPTFNLTATKDWAYGQTGIPFELGGPPVNGAVTVTLLGSVSSTHGNSMGARTLVLNVACNGLVCTVDAPPNAHVCPPGWYQFFVLDGGIPAVGTYVRVGGDPAGLGDWPNLPDFTTPGLG